MHKNRELACSGTVFMVGRLEAVYVEMLDDHGIIWSTHVSTHELLLARVPGLSDNNFNVLFDSAVQNNTQNV